LSARDLDERPPQFMGDLSQLPDHGFSHRSLTWWGLMGIICVETTALALAAASYLYLSGHELQWPPQRIAPDVGWGTAFTVILLLSFVPNMLLDKRAQQEKLGPVRVLLIVMTLIAVVLVVIRYFEFRAMHVAWSDSAYGSAVIVLLALHTVHLVTDLYDTIVLTVLMFTRHRHSGRRFVDTSENAVYWNFVIYVWLPIYLLLYFGPRWL
jgi:heme/copper-type cytochrome/quinol oxidase subunit 3